MTPVADFLIAPLETASPALDLEKVKAETDDIQYVVVLGGGMVDRSPEEGMNGSLSDEAIKRTMYGIRIAKLFNKPLIYSGGRVFPMAGIDAEADAAKRFMEESNEGVTVLYENASRTTWENAKAVSAAYKPKEILLVTSAYHMPRALVAFKKAGINPIPAPTDYKPNRSTYIWEDYFPNLLALHNSCLAFHEYFGLVFYIVRPRG